MYKDWVNCHEIGTNNIIYKSSSVYVKQHLAFPRTPGPQIK